jgi:hypothetical protein
MAIDEADAVLSLLSGSWTAGNTDSITPTFKVIYDVKRIPDDKFRSYDYILTYTGINTITPAGIRGVDSETMRVTIDIRSDGAGQADGRAHVLKVRDEVKRLIRANYKVKIATRYDYINLVSEQDLSDRMKNLHRFVIDVELGAYCITP